ncbi:MAG: hypothetical protein CVU87_01850 [Firmicutes bacterium HGW-Firmicutes-12]|jgi:GntR family transcriptional regulator/MocR family aminotransferase|nr:MAG: hypothetical protein CVU87_01850 [Firmicutes bacterium HGW-Firmicutes-12]
MTLYLFDFNRNIKTPLYIQLYEFIKTEVLAGRLAMDTKMPSIRYFASQLNISKNTVDTAYQQLCAEGYIESLPKTGYFVSAIENNPSSNNNVLPSGHSYLPESIESKVVYDFRSDYIDQDSFSFPIWKKFINKALRDNRKFLTYGNNQGEPALRNEVAKYLRQSRGVTCHPEQIVIGAGVQSLIRIICSILDPSSRDIAFEDPGFKKAQYIFQDHGFNIIPIPIAEDGINIKTLTQSRAKIVYVSPSHQFPLGTTMPVKKRNQLLKWAHENNAFIIEDDYDSELRYFGKPIPSLQGMNGGVNVIYLGSFSKILIPSLRISYMVIPPSLLPIYKNNMNKYNQTSATIEQIALSLFMKEGNLEKHIRRLRKIYTRKNQIIILSIHDIMQDKVSILGKESGLHILLEIKTDLTADKLVNLADKVGVKVTSVSNYYIENSETRYPQILLSFAGIPKDDIVVAIELLHNAWFKS